MTGDYSAREAMDNPEEWPKETNWCAGGCSYWDDTKEGKARYADLKVRWESMKTEPTL
jgi:hypothetical protein